MKRAPYQVGPGWLYVGALPPRERVAANIVTLRLLALWHARAMAAFGGVA